MLKNHPFPVEALFESSFVLTFAVPKEEVQSMIPDCLELDTYQNKWAFIAVAMVQTIGLRPKGLPVFCGNDFFLIGYRIFVRYTTVHGKRLRGLYILKSETNKRKMQFFGNIFTRYNYTTTDITETVNEKDITLVSRKSDFSVTYQTGGDDLDLPEGSPFPDWKTARKYAGPLPFTFSVDKETGKVLIIEGVRQNWNPAPVRVKDYRFGFVDGLGLQGFVLANAFEIRNVPYHWKAGRWDQ